MLHLRVTPNEHEIKLYHIEGFVISIALHISKLPSLLKGEFTEDLYGIKVSSPEEEVKYVTTRFENNKDGELEVTYRYNPAFVESFTYKIIPFGTFSEDGLSVISHNGITLTALNDKSSFKEELFTNSDLTDSKNTIFSCLRSSGDSVKEPTEVHVLKVGDVFAIYNRSYLPRHVLMFIHTDDFTVKEEDSMSSEETAQEDVLVKADPFYLKVVEGVDGVYLYDNTDRVIYINLKSEYFELLLEGKLRTLLSGTTVEGNTVGQKYIIIFETDHLNQLVMRYRYKDEDLPELFISEVHVLGNISKDHTSVIMTDGSIVELLEKGETLSNILLDCKDGKIYTCEFLYKEHEGDLDFKPLTANVVKSNSIFTIKHYFGELITHIHVEDLLRDNEESSMENGSESYLLGGYPVGPDLYVSFDALREYNFLSSKAYGFNLIVGPDISINAQTRGQVMGVILPEGRPTSTHVLITLSDCPDGQTCAIIQRRDNLTLHLHPTTIHRLFFEEHKVLEVKIDEHATEVKEMTEALETNDPTKNMMTAEEARGGSNTVLLNTFSHLNDKVVKAVEEGKRFIDIKPNTTIPVEVKDTVLKSLREDLGYTVEVSFSGEIRISW